MSFWIRNKNLSLGSLGNVEILLGIQRQKVENVKTLSGETLWTLSLKQKLIMFSPSRKSLVHPKISRDDHNVPIALNLQIIAINTLQIASRNHYIYNLLSPKLELTPHKFNSSTHCLLLNSPNKKSQMLLLCKKSWAISIYSFPWNIKWTLFKERQKILNLFQVHY